jgi:hypothetical protein
MALFVPARPVYIYNECVKGKNGGGISIFDLKNS